MQPLGGRAGAFAWTHMCVCLYMYICKYLDMYVYMHIYICTYITLNYITSRSSASHYTSNYITSHGMTWHYSTLYSIHTYINAARERERPDGHVYSYVGC